MNKLLYRGKTYQNYRKNTVCIYCVCQTCFYFSSALFTYDKQETMVMSILWT